VVVDCIADEVGDVIVSVGADASRVTTRAVEAELVLPATSVALTVIELEPDTIATVVVIE
jgi:hypothetical protein